MDADGSPGLATRDRAGAAALQMLAKALRERGLMALESFGAAEVKP